MEPALDHDDYRPPEPSRSSARVWAAIVLALVAVAGYFGWRHYQPVPAPAEAPVVAAPAAEAPPPAPAAAEVPPAVEHPIDATGPTDKAQGDKEAMPALADAGPYVKKLLERLIGSRNALTYLQPDRFVAHAVATVDNLARAQAPVAVWPVNPVPQRFTTLRNGADGTETIHPDNSRRYQPLVSLIESVDTAQAVGLYRDLYPLFQQAYEELGFPGRYFNDRLIQVMDHLIDTPVPAQAPAVQLVDVKGSVPSLRPWVRYEFVDPQLQSLSAGRKILLRVGADNQRRLQAKLADIRRQLVKK
ncbi:DUF3014 domain-containing protein [Hydrogenophaga sp. MI9]|uniref:DUF3014 domain-containing protein n=1 Tax=Hydrogenophaga sp. MI9 TaxID=3453719 RepID=UPI003EEE6179